MSLNFFNLLDDFNARSSVLSNGAFPVQMIMLDPCLFDSITEYKNPLWRIASKCKPRNPIYPVEEFQWRGIVIKRGSYET